MPDQIKWNAEAFPPVLHSAMAVYMILGLYVVNLEDDACICVLPEKETVAVVLYFDEKDDLVFHVGDLGDKTRTEMEELLGDYIDQWDALSDEELEVIAKEHIPITPWYPIVAGQLETKGYFTSGRVLVQ